MNKTEIKACPICGKHPIVIRGEKAGNGEWVKLPMVWCQPCDFQRHGRTDNEAMERWNVRPDKTQENYALAHKLLGKEVVENGNLQAQLREAEATITGEKLKLEILRGMYACLESKHTDALAIMRDLVSNPDSADFDRARQYLCMDEFSVSGAQMVNEISQAEASNE